MIEKTFMAEYDLRFSASLVRAAKLVASDGLDSINAQRTVLYLSLLSTEIALKCLLESAGVPISAIKKRNHDLSALMKDIDRCEIRFGVTPEEVCWKSASSLRSKVIDPKYGNATVGTLLEAESHHASKYPNAVRYGGSLKHYPAAMVMSMSEVVLDWTTIASTNIRQKNISAQ